LRACHASAGQRAARQGPRRVSRRSSGDASPPCAADGLNRVTALRRRERRLCAEGDALSKAGKRSLADARYVEALHLDAASACAKKGLAPAEEDDFWDDIGEVVEYLPKIPAALGAVAALVLVPLGLVLLAVVLIRRRRPSLVIRPLTDAGVGAKVGEGVGALIEQRLLALAERTGRRRDTYELDIVITDVELLAEQEDLATAVGGIAEVSQLQLVVALLGLLDRGGRGRLAVGGALLPPGDEGPGIALALHQRNGVRARTALWDTEVASWMPGSGTAPPPPPVGPDGEATSDAENDGGARPYYRLAIPAASWVQYAAARALKVPAGRLTVSAESFALVASGLEFHRDGKFADATEAYVRALVFDPDNVAALVNLALLLARAAGSHPLAMALLIRAEQALVRRHRELA
jgi:tetratricopeptide (TPR) repeat protein